MPTLVRMGHRWLGTFQLDDAYRRIASAIDGNAPVFSLRQAAVWGVSRAEVLALQRAKHVCKIRHGAYCLAETWNSAQHDDGLKRRVLASAAMACMRHPAYACGPFAAELHGLPLPSWEPTMIDLVRDAGIDVRPARDGVKPANRLDGVAIISRDVSKEDLVAIGGIPSVGLGVAAMTAAARLDLEYAVAVMDAALGRGLPQEALEDVAHRWTSTKGMRLATRHLTHARVGAESPLESISRVRLVKRGLPEPLLQHEFRDAHGFVGRVDMWWREWCVIGEADGLGKYDDIAVLRREKVREDRLRALGMTVVRWTWDEMWNAPGDVVARILAAKSLRSRSRNAG